MDENQSSEKSTAVDEILEEETLTDDIKKIIGGVATIVLLVVPVLLIRKLVRTIEEGETFKKIERTLS